MAFEKLTLVEFHLETDEFKPSATASLGGRGGTEDARGASATGRGRGRGRGMGSLLALGAVIAAFALTRRLQRR